MFDPSDEERDTIFRDLKGLVAWGFRVDIGARWQDWDRLREFEVNDPDSTVVKLPYGSTDHPGFELLPREVVHVVLTGAAGPPPRRRDDRPAMRLIAEVLAQATFEPVPVETLLWDGRASSFSSGAILWQALQPPKGEEPVFEERTKAGGRHARKAAGKTKRSKKKR